MATADFSDAGVVNVNGQWATSMRYAADVVEQQVVGVRLRFMNGRHEVASAELRADEARALLGENTFAVIEKAGRQVRSAAEVVGDVRGQALQMREVVLPGHATPERNAIEPDVGGPTAAEHPSAAARTSQVNEADSPVDPGTPDSVPAWVRERFIALGKRYYFPDHTLAFVDDGRRLKAETNNPEAVRALIAIAQARGWSAVKATGSDTFRQLVWREGSRHGIDVRGYAPTELERTEMARAADASQPTAGPDHGKRLDGNEAARASPALGATRLQGKLVEHGAAPYRFEAAGAMSYYLKLQTPAGERTLWGVDLERAIVESATRVRDGDGVAIENQGSLPVTVKALKRDGDGKVSDTRIETHRNRWLVEKPAYFDERARRAEAFRHGEPTVHQTEPDLATAAVNVWLAQQFAGGSVESAADRERITNGVRERLADALARGDAISSPELKEAARERLQRQRRDVEPRQRTRVRATPPVQAHEVREQAAHIDPQMPA